MGRILKRLLFTLSLSFLASCSTELKVQTKAMDADCEQFPDAAECVSSLSEVLNLNFKILTENFVTNSESAAFKWEAVNGVASYEVIIARNKDCSLEAVSYQHFETNLNVGLLGVGEFFLCVYALDGAGARAAATNNPIQFTVDREQPKVKASASAADVTPTNSPRLPKVSLEDATALKTIWIQKAGPGTISFADATKIDSGISVSLDGTYTVTLNVTDAAGNITTRDFVIKVDTTPPTVNPGADITASGVAQNLNGSFTGDAVTLAWTMGNAPAGGAVTFGTPSNIATTALPGVAGVYTVTFTATDAAGNSASDSLLLSWSPGNTLPVLQTIADQPVYEGSPISQIDGNDTSGGDTDLDGQALTYSCKYDTTVDGNVNAGADCSGLAGFSLNTTTGVLDWTPDYTTSGRANVASGSTIYEMGLHATDGTANVVEIFTITVSKNEVSPNLVAITSQTVAENANLPLDANDVNSGGDTDRNGDTIVYTCRFDPTSNDAMDSGTVKNCTDPSLGASFDTDTGLFDLTPAYDKSALGTIEVEIVANDNLEPTTAIYFDLTITNTNRAPNIVPVTGPTIAEKAALTPIDANDATAANDTDADGEAITWTCYYDTTVDGSVATTSACSTLPGDDTGTFTAAGVLNWTPGYAEAGSYEIRFHAEDPSASIPSIWTLLLLMICRDDCWKNLNQHFHFFVQDGVKYHAPNLDSDKIETHSLTAIS